MKQAYISPPAGILEVTVVRDKDPFCTILLDLGIPNFTVFSLKMPVVPDHPEDMTALLSEALSALLDDMSAFMIAMEYEEKIIVAIYALALATFKELKTDTGATKASNDNTVVTYAASFQLPQAFVNETRQKVVVGSRVIKRVPPVRHIELTHVKPTKVQVEDVGKVIRQYKNRSLKTQPKPMYVVVYDMRGRPTGTIPIGSNFKNNLLKMMKGSAAPAQPQFTDTLHFERDSELRYKNAVGIPEAIFLSGGEYYPEASCGDDMALYTDGQERYLVKFPDGRVVKFRNRPSIKQLKTKNYPVPRSIGAGIWSRSSQK